MKEGTWCSGFRVLSSASSFLGELGQVLSPHLASVLESDDFSSNHLAFTVWMLRSHLTLTISHPVENACRNCTYFTARSPRPSEEQ